MAVFARWEIGYGFEFSLFRDFEHAVASCGAGLRGSPRFT
jgi:hypothetical protein